MGQQRPMGHFSTDVRSHERVQIAQFALPGRGSGGVERETTVKAGGGGKGDVFPGYCNFCGEYGHRLNQCRWKTAQVRKLRGGANALILENFFDDDDDDDDDALCGTCDFGSE